MVVWRCIHKSQHKLEVGDILLPPTVQADKCEDVDEGDPMAFANFPQFCDGQHENVYFSILGSEAERLYGGGSHVYVVEPLNAVEIDPEDLIYNPGVTGSLRSSSARIVEVLA